MLKLTVAVLGIALAGSVQAAGWRSMRIDAASEASFNQSATALSQKLPPVRRHVFEESLKDIWEEGKRAAEADQREYSVDEFLRQVHGLKYKEVVTFVDPSGDTADRYFDQGFARLYTRRAPPGQQNQIPDAWRNTAGVATYSGSHGLDAGQSYRANGRVGGTHH